MTKELRRLLAFCVIAITAVRCKEIRRAGCSDIHDWCKTSANFCHVTSAMKIMCPRTCDACLPPECDDCEQACEVVNKTAKCTCYKGYKLESDGLHCEDINECEENEGICTDNTTECTNMPGGYYCGWCNKYSANDYTSYYSDPLKCCKMNFGTCGNNTQNSQPSENVAPVSPKILGGQNATFGMWPWQAYIVVKGQICGGSLINDQWVVTAAHCLRTVRDLDQDQLYVRFGVYNTSDLQAPAIEVRRVEKMIRHEKFRFPNNDIALLKLNESLVFNDAVSPICLPNGELPSPGTTCYATGYGVTVIGGSQSQLLQQVGLPFIDGETCKKAYEGEHEIDTETMVCAGGEEGKDACQGDSGGPLVCQRCNSCEWYLAGVTSFGSGCGDPKFYGVYAHVEHFEKWIEKNIEEVAVKKQECKPAGWTSWRAWGKCSRSCGGGKQSRRRICQNGEEGLPGCLGERIERRDCNRHPCDAPDKDSWTQWTRCPVTCGGGLQTRQRICVTKGCQEIEENRECNANACPAWTEWGRWTECDATCGDGERTRARTCENGESGQQGCQGPESQIELCNIGACPSWGNWEEWSECSESCGGGVQTSVRQCEGGIAGEDCPGFDTRTKSCNTEKCKGRFGPWSRWSKCSDRCGTGTQTRTRTCTTSECVSDEFGQSTQAVRKCNTHECTGEWTAWSPWESCSKTCGVGARRRVRSCEGGTKCAGPRLETEECTIESCPWSAWSPWGGCSVTCGDGFKTRTRTCPAGSDCAGSGFQERICRMMDCAEWGPWEMWTSCSSTCGGGSRSRTRECVRGACEGASLETEDCATEPCGASCEGRCGHGVMSGYCLTATDWMNSFCPSSCCTTFCRNTWDECEKYGPTYCGDSNFAAACLRMCGYCK